MDFSIVQFLILGIVISSDNLAVAMALGALGQIGQKWRIALMFGVAAFVVPLIGIWVGREISTYLEDNLNWIGSLLLAIVGGWTVVAAFRRKDEQEDLAEQVTTWGGLVLLTASTSIDNLVVGLSLGIQGRPVFVIAILSAGFVVAFTFLGIRIGNAARRHWEQYATIAAGIMLILLAIATWAEWI
jgi:manganese efflux pump family protein